jgi:outer membrane protein TolC
LQEAYDNGDDGIDDTELFRLEVFKAEFDIQKAEVIEGLLFVKRAWAYVLRNDQNIVYVPNTVFLDPLAKNLEDVSYYQTSALQYRPEIRSIGFTQAGISNFIASLEAQARPQLILGMSTTFASTPIRPRQRNPFIVNQGNTFNTGLGFTIRQNLNFMQIRPNIERSKIELRRIDFLKMSAQDGIMLEVTDAYRQAKLSEVRVEKTDDALVKTKEWLRQEQLDIDFGIGDTRDFVDALQKELELKLALKEVVFEYNMNLAELNRTAGFSVTSLID